MNFRRSAAGKARAVAIPSPSRNPTAAGPAMELDGPSGPFSPTISSLGNLNARDFRVASPENENRLAVTGAPRCNVTDTCDQ